MQIPETLSNLYVIVRNRNDVRPEQTDVYPDNYACVSTLRLTLLAICEIVSPVRYMVSLRRRS